MMSSFIFVHTSYLQLQFGLKFMSYFDQCQATVDAINHASRQPHRGLFNCARIHLFGVNYILFAIHIQVQYIVVYQNAVGCIICMWITSTSQNIFPCHYLPLVPPLFSISSTCFTAGVSEISKYLYSLGWMETSPQSMHYFIYKLQPYSSCSFFLVGYSSCS